MPLKMAKTPTKTELIALKPFNFFPELDLSTSNVEFQLLNQIKALIQLCLSDLPSSYSWIRY